MTRNISLLAAAVAAASLFSAAAHASGFKINEQSASGVGTAYAGRAAVAEDASVVFFNPAGMSKLTRPELSVGFTYIDVQGSFEGSRINPAGVPSVAEAGAYDNGGDFVPNPVIPFFYYVRPVDEKFSLGLGIFVPYGTQSDYSDNALVGAFADETRLASLDIQPTFSYKLTDTLAIGGGIDIVYIKGTLSKQLDLIPYVPAGHPAESVLNNQAYMGYENTFEVEGDDYGYGWNLGLMWDITPRTTFGFAYRSEVAFDLEGDARFKQDSGVKVFNAQMAQGGHPAVGSDGLVYADAAIAAMQGTYDPSANYTGAVNKQSARVPLKGPRSATFSLAHRVNDALQLQGGVTWTDWSSFKYFDVIATGPGIIDDLGGLGENYIGHIVEKWRDTVAVAIGATYTLNDQWLLRAGYAFDQSPVKDQHRTARVPDNDRQWLTAGARYALNQDISFDLGMAYLFIDQSELNEYNYKLDDTPKGVENASGTYDMDALGVSLQMNYRM